MFWGVGTLANIVVLQLRLLVPRNTKNFLQCQFRKYHIFCLDLLPYSTWNLYRNMVLAAMQSLSTVSGKSHTFGSQEGPATPNKDQTSYVLLYFIFSRSFHCQCIIL